ncbi:MAG: alpha/beta hydrolase [Planctomycetota bacterium]
MSKKKNGLSRARYLSLRLRRLAIEGMFNGLARGARLRPSADPARHGVKLTRDLSYRDTGLVDHRLDVYQPEATEPRPVVIYAHGGGFTMLSKETHWSAALRFARKGYVVFNINYRLAPKNRFPAAIDDVCRAYAWVIENAARFGGDPSRVVVAGESAGANLVSALTLATCTRHEHDFAQAAFETGVVPEACLPFCGILQVSDPERFRRRKPSLPSMLHDQILGVAYGYAGNTPASELALGDPLRSIERIVESDPELVLERPLPPFFVACGTKDPILDDSRRLAAALKNLSVPCEAPIYPGEIHAFQAFSWRPAARDCWTKAFRFLGEHTSAPKVPVSA